MTLSVVIIAYNEEANIGRTLESVMPLVRDDKGEIIVVDSRSIDRTVEIAKSFGAKVFVEEWKGYAAQKNSAIDKATGEWILSLDADEEVDPDLQQALHDTVDGLQHTAALQESPGTHPFTMRDAQADVEYHTGTKLDGGFAGLWIPRKNLFLGRWIRHGGYWPDPKLRFFRRGVAGFEDRPVHEDVKVEGRTNQIRYGAILHHAYPTLSDYLDHMNRYSSLGAEMIAGKEKPHPVAENATRVGHPGIGFSVINIVLRPLATFIYNYFFRLGFLDGREGLLLHLYHAVYVSWKYAKAWELQRKAGPSQRSG